MYEFERIMSIMYLNYELCQELCTCPYSCLFWPYFDIQLEYLTHQLNMDPNSTIIPKILISPRAFAIWQNEASELPLICLI